MCNIYHGISLNLVNEIFSLRHQNQYNLRNWSEQSFNHGSESVRCLGPKVCEIIPAHIKESNTDK